MTSEWRTEYSQGVEEWKNKIAEAIKAAGVAERNWLKATVKTAISNGTVAADLYDRLIKAGDEKTKWSTIAERDPHPGWIKRKEEAIALYEATQEEWDTAHKEKTKWEEICNTSKYETSQLKEAYDSWNKEMIEKGRYLYKKEEMRQQAKKID